MKHTRVMLISFLTIIISFLLASCSQPLPDYYTYTLDNQIRNHRYYFQQGYNDNWDATYNPEDYALDEKSLLLTELSPKDSDGKAIYSIYTGDTKIITTTVIETAHKLIKTDDLMFYNTRFIKNEQPRENFVITNSEMQTVIYNKLQYKKISYSFTKDGENWEGDLFVVMDGSKYFIITWEKAESVGEKYQKEFVDTIKDFRFIGFEDN